MEARTIRGRVERRNRGDCVGSFGNFHMLSDYQTGKLLPGWARIKVINNIKFSRSKLDFENFFSEATQRYSSIFFCGDFA